MLYHPKKNNSRNLHSTVSTVGTTTVLGGLVDNDAGDVKFFNVQTLGFSVGFSVLQEVSDELDGLDGPATLSGLEFLGLGSTTNTTVEVTERNDLLVFSDVLQVAVSLAQLQTLNSNSDFMGVLELLVIY